MYQVRLLKGVKEPYITANQLEKAETITGFWKKLGLLFIMTIILSAVAAYFGIGNEILSKNLGDAEFEATKGLFAIGQIILSIVTTTIILLLPSLFFWAISDIEWKKYIVLQLFVIMILLLEKAIVIPLTIALGITEVSNPFSLGIIGQYITNNEIILSLLAQITIFKIWTIVLQFKYIRVFTELSAKRIALYLIVFHLIVIVVTVLLSMMQLEKLL